MINENNIYTRIFNYDENDMVCDSYEYDVDADVVSITQYNYNDYTYSVEASNGVILDFDSQNNIIGIKLLYASQVLKESKTTLYNLSKISAKIIFDENTGYNKINFTLESSLWNKIIYKCSLFMAKLADEVNNLL